MAGIYVHIPFCKKACHYCNFHFSTSLQQKQEMVYALAKEILLRKHYLQEPVETIYFGGGTPSLLQEGELDILLSCLRENFTHVADAEITIEANPDDITKEQLAVWRRLGINRLSIGIQSFRDEELQWMNRAHNADQATQSIELAQGAGFTNLTIDLIYGTPELTDDAWMETVKKAVSLRVPHLSCYALTVEPRTALAKKIKTRQYKDVDVDTQARHFSILTGQLKEAGFEHYEISNFALPGFRSKHNSSYWQGKFYLGLGPSAHSFNGRGRQWNVANNAAYLSAIVNGNIPFEEELLTEKQRLNEYIMTSLRTIEGLSLTKVREQWGEETEKNISAAAASYLQTGKLLLQQDIYRLSDEGKFLADGIAADLFQL